jgi:hypothetical protein
MNTAILAFLVATALRPNGDMRDVSMRPPAGVVSSSTVTIDAMPYARTVVCGEYIEVTGTASGGGAVTWSASPSGDSGSCTGTDSWACLVGVSPDDVGEGIETITVTSGTATDAVTIGFYVAGSHSCFLAQDIDGSYNATLANLDAVATWSNSGTSGLDVTQGTGTAQPTFRTNIVGGQPVVRCDGGDFVSAAAAADWTFLHNGTGSTMDAVVSMATTGLSPIAGTSTGAPTNRGIGWRTTTTAKAGYFLSNGTSLTINMSSADNVFTANTFNQHLVTSAVADTPDATGYINGTSVVTGSGAVSASAAANPLRVCVRGDGTTSFMTGDVFALLIYQSALSSTQRGINKAVDEWALGGTLPVTP